MTLLSIYTPPQAINFLICIHCGGTGKILGGVKVGKDCIECFGTGEMDAKPKIDKASHHYKNAVKKIRKLNKVSNEEAERIFEEEYQKLEEH
ncbi:MAG TPA: hypothetical protein VKR58_11925 [Aquella sp.]|nr:hypothetical protein [Aquella sp.]